MSNINRRQFIIMRDRFEDKDFLSMELSCGLVLSYQKDLKITVDGNNVLLGYAFSCLEKEKEVEKLSEDRMRNWSGRWVLITKSAIYMDACGTLGLFYTQTHENHLIISSSLSLLKKITNAEWNADFDIERIRGHFRDFFPKPYTPYENVMGLLPSQYINLSINEVSNRKDFDFNRYSDLSCDMFYNRFIDEFKFVFEHINSVFSGNIWIPMTSGVDSRSVLACAIASNLLVKTYTIKRKNWNEWDYRTAQRIGKKLGVSHMFLDNTTVLDEKIEKKRIEEVISHSGGRVSIGTEVAQYCYNTDVPNADKSIILWGCVWEICQHYYAHYLKDFVGYEEAVDGIENVSFACMHDSKIHDLSFRAWLRHTFNYPVKGLQWTDQLFWEQRMGTWLSYSHQVFDMFDSVRICPINCQELLELLYSAISIFGLSEDEVYNKKIQKMIINQCCPKLGRITYGEPVSIPYRAYRKMIRAINKRWGGYSTEIDDEYCLLEVA